MSDWISIEPFGYSEVVMSDGRPRQPINTTTNGSGSIAPPIIATVDYLLRDENNLVITDENNEPISLEGLKYA